MAGNVQGRIEFFADGKEGRNRTAHVVQVAFESGDVVHNFIPGAGLEGHSEEFHHAHRVGQPFERCTVSVVDNGGGAHGLTG